MSEQFSEEELKAIEAEMERVSVDDVLLQTLVTLLNLGARKAGLAVRPGDEPKRDMEQVKQAIDGARTLLPLLEARHAEELRPVKDALSRLQMAYVQFSGEKAAPGEPEQETPKPGEPGPAQRSGKLWVPGQ